MRKDAPGPGAGLSLVELLASTAVLAILLGLSMPTFSETLRRMRVASAMHQLGAQLAQVPASHLSNIEAPAAFDGALAAFLGATV